MLIRSNNSLLAASLLIQFDFFYSTFGFVVISIEFGLRLALQSWNFWFFGRLCFWMCFFCIVFHIIFFFLFLLFFHFSFTLTFIFWHRLILNFLLILTLFALNFTFFFLIFFLFNEIFQWATWSFRLLGSLNNRYFFTFLLQIFHLCLWFSTTINGFGSFRLGFDFLDLNLWKFLFFALGAILSNVRTDVSLATLNLLSRSLDRL